MELMDKAYTVVPKKVFDLINNMGETAIYYLLKAHDGDDYYIVRWMVEDGIIDTIDDALEIQNYAEETSIHDLFNLVHGVTFEWEPPVITQLSSADIISKATEH